MLFECPSCGKKIDVAVALSEEEKAKGTSPVGVVIRAICLECERAMKNPSQEGTLH